MIARVKAIEDLPALRDVIAQHGLSAQKSLGQNFLLDINITDKIVREAQAHDSESWENVNAIEIGPGPGGLTRSLLKSHIQSLTSIEFDRRAVEALQALRGAVGEDLRLIQEDALKVDFLEITQEPRVVVANLPYNIATPLLLKWLKLIRQHQNSIQSMALMFQKEVADRIVAQTGAKSYGRLAIISQWLCEVKIIYDLPPSAFTPPPKVNSAVVFFKPKPLENDPPTFEAVESVTAAAFQQRRKMVRSSLKNYLPIIEKLGFDPTVRAENLSVRDFINLAKLF
ncbi:MAG: 16S rRNA (adenine(1518)-N(6)/adenine(1519)-N(6))-dimethyltransferase RsmA [Alphaproteobacteria bacterium]|nr:16S rRNA (adenine(1518)-N(6)/adenine(1519)-N(6))-dimethyltransferase RsmA [Alphaproteobacteria bacterium]